jgi:hypothetical protein
MELEFSRQIFEKSLNIKCHQSPSIGSRVVPCGRTDMKLTVAFRNFANAFEKDCYAILNIFSCKIRSKLS